MNEWKGKFSGMVENVDGYIIGNSSGVLTIGFEYSGDDTAPLPCLLNQGLNEIAKLTESMGADNINSKPHTYPAYKIPEQIEL